MNRETDLLEFLEEIIELRIHSRTTEATYQSEFAKLNIEMAKFWESVTDEAIHGKLIEYEELKNHHHGLMVARMYREGLEDAVSVLRLLLKMIFTYEL